MIRGILKKADNQSQRREGREAGSARLKLMGILAVFLVCCGFVYAQAGSWRDSGGYRVFAEFDNAAGLKTGDQAEIAGVRIGEVVSVGLTERDRARIQIRINDNIALPSDSRISIKPRGMSGDKVLSIERGHSGKAIKPGEAFIETRSLASLEEIVGEYILDRVSWPERKQSGLKSL